MASSPEDITRILHSARMGNSSATSELYPMVYEELRNLAESLLRRESRAPITLQPTALVHEAYLRLLGPLGNDQQWENRAHFFGAASLAMRRILIDRARHIKSMKGVARPIELDQAIQGGVGGGVEGGLPTLSENQGASDIENAEEILALDQAMLELATRDERQHQVVMLRFFAGLTVEQTAMALGCSNSTVKNDWSFARAWLIHRVGKLQSQ